MRAYMIAYRVLLQLPGESLYSEVVLREFFRFYCQKSWNGSMIVCAQSAVIHDCVCLVNSVCNIHQALYSKLMIVKEWRSNIIPLKIFTCFYDHDS